MFSIHKISDDSKYRKDMFKGKRKSVEEIWEGEQISGVTDIVRFAPIACNSQPWLVKNDGELLVYRYKKPGKRGIMPADKVSFYNCIDMGIFILYLPFIFANTKKLLRKQTQHSMTEDFFDGLDSTCKCLENRLNKGFLQLT